MPMTTAALLTCRSTQRIRHAPGESFCPFTSTLNRPSERESPVQLITSSRTAAREIRRIADEGTEIGADPQKFLANLDINATTTASPSRRSSGRSVARRYRAVCTTALVVLARIVASFRATAPTSVSEGFATEPPRPQPYPTSSMYLRGYKVGGFQRAA